MQLIRAIVGTAKNQCTTRSQSGGPERCLVFVDFGTEAQLFSGPSSEALFRKLARTRETQGSSSLWELNLNPLVLWPGHNLKTTTTLTIHQETPSAWKRQDGPI